MTASDVTDPGFPCDSPLTGWNRWRTPKYVPTISTRATIPVPSHFQGKRFSAWNATVSVTLVPPCLRHCSDLGDPGLSRQRRDRGSLPDRLAVISVSAAANLHCFLLPTIQPTSTCCCRSVGSL